MATFVLVHGAMHGGWCWKRVAPLLRAAGHDVYAPTLTGLGERAHLAHAGIDLATHVQDVVGVLEYEDLDRVVLVGHSYAGTVVAGVTDRLPGRIAHLVHLDAAEAGDGQAVLDLVPPEFRAAERALVAAEGDGWHDAMVERARTEPRWRCREVATGHDAMITAPREIADLLLKAAGPASCGEA